MPRFFFNIHGDVDMFDKTGVELANQRELRLHMIPTALAFFQIEDSQKVQWSMEAIDERGRIVSTMDFGLETGHA